jgi:hypothetical protein
MFSADGLISNYYPSLDTKKSFTRKQIIALLRTLFHKSEIQQFERKYAHLAGFDFIDEVLKYFDFTERIPSHGSVVIVANQPIGTLDGLALLNLVRKVRPDVKVVANYFLRDPQKQTRRSQQHYIRCNIDDYHGNLTVFQYY